MNLWMTVRSKTGVVAMSLGVVAAAGLAAAVPVLTHPAGYQQPADEVFVAPTQTPAATTDAPAPAAVEQPVAAPEPATVETVTEPAPQAPAAEPTVDQQPAAPAKPYDAAAPWVDPNSGKTFTPAAPATMEKLPGEGETLPPTN